MTFILGNFFEPVDQAKILLPIPIIFVIVAFFMPQTPEYWIRKNNQEVGPTLHHITWSFLENRFTNFILSIPACEKVTKIL